MKGYSLLGVFGAISIHSRSREFERKWLLSTHMILIRPLVSLRRGFPMSMARLKYNGITFIPETCCASSPLLFFVGLILLPILPSPSCFVLIECTRTSTRHCHYSDTAYSTDTLGFVAGSRIRIIGSKRICTLFSVQSTLPVTTTLMIQEIGLKA